MVCSFLRCIYFVIFPLLLVACGGGGGGGGGHDNVSAQTPALLTFSPSQINETYGVGDSISLIVTATPTQTISEQVYVQIVDDAGIITTNVSISANPNGSYTATLHTSPNLRVGTYSGNLLVKLCLDTDCSSQYNGSPIPLPYRLQVTAAGNLSPLSPWPTASHWTTFQGNAAHTGAVPVTLNPANFSPRWRYNAPGDAAVVSEPAIVDGQVYVSVNCTRCTGNYDAYVTALSEHDGSTLWSSPIITIEWVSNAPAASSTQVFLISGLPGTMYLSAFDALTGTQQFQTPFSSQSNNFLAPVIDGNSLFTESGYYSGISSFNTNTGGHNWTTQLTQCLEWSPAVDSQYVYVYSPSCGTYFAHGLKILNKSTGAEINTIDDGDSFWLYNLMGAPLLDGNGNVVVVQGTYAIDPNQLTSFNTNTMSRNWQVSGFFETQPALAQGVLYVAQSSPAKLEARDTTTGDVLWSWTPPAEEGRFQGNIVATNNLVFCSTDKYLHAISLSTHKSVWTYWKPGNIAISKNGVLYVSSRDHVLSAVNLK